MLFIIESATFKTNLIPCGEDPGPDIIVINCSAAAPASNLSNNLPVISNSLRMLIYLHAAKTSFGAVMFWIVPLLES